MSIEMPGKDDKTYIVLGASGSATSFISKCLELGGVNMGRVKTEKKERFYEDPAFVRLNTRMICAAGGDWMDPPSEEEILKVDFDESIKAKIAQKKSRFWGFKDPRTAFTIKKYLPHLEDDVYLVCVFRKPKRVLKRWGYYSVKTTTKKMVDNFNNAIISAIKEFVEL